MNPRSTMTGTTSDQRVLCGLLIVLMLPCCLTRTAQACTSFAMESEHGLLFGSNFDNDFRSGLLYVNKRGVSKSGWPMDENDTPATWTSKYGSVTIHTAPYQYAWAGMNEAGLVISTMQLDETQVPPPDERPSLLSAAWVQYVLDSCATVEDIIAAERRVRLNFGVDHYLACDATGQCMSIEFLKGKPVYHQGDSLPLKALTAGWPYARCFDQRYGGSVSDAKPSKLAGPLPRIHDLLRDYQPAGSEADVNYAFRILNAASAENTTWSLVFDLQKRVVFIRSYKNKRVRYIVLSDLDFSCSTPVMMLDVHTKHVGNLAKHLQEYSHEAALQHTLRAVAFHRPDIPEETVRQMLQQIERFPCTDAE